ncbi:MAG: hypothetical protein VYE73_12140 [Acidobacteriota bacterium]|nr:hypothetical protein [Acidobacteriota bacterium]
MQSEGEVISRIGDGEPTPVDNARFVDGFLHGRAQGRLGTPDVQRTPYDVALDLKLRGDVLKGAAMAMGHHTPQRVRKPLSHWAELKRAR